MRINLFLPCQIYYLNCNLYTHNNLIVASVMNSPQFESAKRLLAKGVDVHNSFSTLIRLVCWNLICSIVTSCNVSLCQLNMKLLFYNCFSLQLLSNPFFGVLDAKMLDDRISQQLKTEMADYVIIESVMPEPKLTPAVIAAVSNYCNTQDQFRKKQNKWNSVE